MVVTRRKRSKKQEESPKRSSSAAAAVALKGSVDKNTVRRKRESHLKTSDRWDPVQRGIHSDAIMAGEAPSSAAECVDCGKKIVQGSYRWGIKYAGNPLPVPVIPLYGSHPMYLWCHAGGCGLAFVRPSTMMDSCEAAQTCHLCQDSGEATIKLLCGGPPKGKKIRQHAFHWCCWQKAIEQTAPNEEALKQLLVPPQSIHGKCGLSWNDLTPQEQQSVCG